MTRLLSPSVAPAGEVSTISLLFLFVWQPKYRCTYPAALKDNATVLPGADKDCHVLCRLTIGDYAGALADVNRAIKLRPDYAFALTQRAACRSDLKCFPCSVHNS